MTALTSPGFYNAYVKLPDAETPCPLEIETNPKLYPFLKDTVGSFDCTQVEVNPPSEDRAHFRNRKGRLTLNVLAGCTFDLLFCYVLSGWEGSAADGTVFKDARKNDLTMPEGKYYLADASFGSCDSLLVPY